LFIRFNRQILFYDRIAFQGLKMKNIRLIIIFTRWIFHGEKCIE